MSVLALFVSVCFAQFTTGVSIRAADVNTLRASVDAKRVGCGLAAQVWSDNPLAVGMPIKQIHMAELRTAVTAAYSSQATTPPPFTDPTLTAGTPIRAIHFQEISSDVAALVCVAVVNGSCGPANGNSYGTAALANAAGLCGAGTAAPTSLAGSGPWSWSCTGSGPSHTDASCGATQIVAPVCTGSLLAASCCSGSTPVNAYGVRAVCCGEDMIGNPTPPTWYIPPPAIHGSTPPINFTNNKAAGYINGYLCGCGNSPVWWPGAVSGC